MRPTLLLAALLATLYALAAPADATADTDAPPTILDDAPPLEQAADVAVGELGLDAIATASVDTAPRTVHRSTDGRIEPITGAGPQHYIRPDLLAVLPRSTHLERRRMATVIALPNARMLRSTTAPRAAPHLRRVLHEHRRLRAAA